MRTNIFGPPNSPNFNYTKMDVWTVLLLVALMTGIMGWFVTPFTSAIIYICMMCDGDPIDWGLEVAFSVAVPFAWVFAIMEIILLYRL